MAKKKTRSTFRLELHGRLCGIGGQNFLCLVTYWVVEEKEKGVPLIKRRLKSLSFAMRWELNTPYCYCHSL
jgi:hypothetical protein